MRKNGEIHTLVRYSLLFAISFSMYSNNALWSWTSRNTASTSARVNSGGGSEKVTLPSAEIVAWISFVSICDPVQRCILLKEATTHHV